jgi:hypothetical protein
MEAQMELTADNVRKIINECLFKEGEDTSNAQLAQGVVMNMGFHPDRIKATKSSIIELLHQLPDSFMKGKGGGHSFLNACVRKDGIQWGEHRDIDCLVCLGIAAGVASWCLSRDLWQAMPGGMPYFVVNV